jgi:hypothetical protein
MQIMLQVFLAVAFTLYSSNLKQDLVYAQVKIEVSRDALLTALFIGIIT